MPARLRLLEGSWVSLQDAGRIGHARHGVGPGGPMDPLTHLLAVRLAGAPAAAGTTAIEVGPGGARIGVDAGPVEVAIAGPGARLSTGHDAVQAPAVLRLVAGDVVEIGGSCRWAVLAPRGRIAVAPELGSTSRHDRADLGPRWSIGQTLLVDTDAVGAGLPPIGTRPGPRTLDQPLLLLPAPQTHLFSPADRARLTGADVVVDRRGDRMAQRLGGVTLSPVGGHDIVSDAVVAGALQVQGDGAPWVLTAEHQPTGGYPKVAVLAVADRSRFVQLGPGAPVRFAWGTVVTARERWQAAVASVASCLEAPVRPAVTALRRAPLAGDVHAAGD